MTFLHVDMNFRMLMVFCVYLIEHMIVHLTRLIRMWHPFAWVWETWRIHTSGVSLSYVNMTHAFDTTHSNLTPIRVGVGNMTHSYELRDVFICWYDSCIWHDSLASDIHSRERGQRDSFIRLVHTSNTTFRMRIWLIYLTWLIQTWQPFMYLLLMYLSLMYLFVGNAYSDGWCLVEPRHSWMISFITSDTTFHEVYESQTVWLTNFTSL